jgi:glycosyl transferase family 92
VSGPHDPTFNLAIVAVIRNEAPYLDEWIAYHNMLGVEHFFIYENNSDDDPRTVLKRYINHGLVTLVEFPVNGVQVPAYRHAVHFFGHSTRWLSQLDLDEFIVPKIDPDIPTMLERLGEVDRVDLPWRNFGFSGHRTRPSGLVIENYVMAEDIPEGGVPVIAVKSISRSSAITTIGGHSTQVAGDRVVDASGNRPQMVPGRMVQPSYASAQVNHYVTRSEDEFNRKVARGEPNREVPRRLYTVEEEQGFATPDDSVARFIEPTRQKMDEFLSMSPSPFRYGSHVQLRFPHADRFMMNAATSISNYLHGMQIVRNRTKQIENLSSAPRAYVVQADGRRGLEAGKFSSTLHWPDLVRRQEGVVAWQLGLPGQQAPTVADGWSELDGGQLVVTPDGPHPSITIPSGTGRDLVHLALVAVIEVEAPTELVWSTRSTPLVEGASTQLPGHGRFVCMVEANLSLARCEAATIGVSTTAGAVVFDDLLLMSYG